VTRFNESIDQSITQAVASYTRKVDQSRDLFLAILSHDLLNPLAAIEVLAQMIERRVQADTKSVAFATQITSSASTMGRMISNLLDYMRTRLGAGMPVIPSPTNLRPLCETPVLEFSASHPDREIFLSGDGDLSGNWDADRLRQAISNLVGNAFQHGDIDKPVEITAWGEPNDVFDEVRNSGDPVSPRELAKIFEPLVRGSGANKPIANRPGSIGMGLYIAHEVAKSHGGGITVTSTQVIGTSFIVKLPRQYLRKSGQPILDQGHKQVM